MTKAELHKIIHEEIQNHIIEEGITSWMIDKVANGFKWATNKQADYQYDALLKSKDFRSLASHYKMSERDWENKARELISRDPKKFANILAYDYSTSKLHQLGIW